MKTHLIITSIYSILSLLIFGYVFIAHIKEWKDGTSERLGLITFFVFTILSAHSVFTNFKLLWP